MTVARYTNLFETVRAEVDRPLVRLERMLGKISAGAAMTDNEGTGHRRET